MHSPVPRDAAASASAIVFFSFSLGISNLALPLLALKSGYSNVEVGLLTSLSALAQLLVRTSVPLVSRLLPDRHLVSGACGLLMGSCALLLLGTIPLLFAAAELLQGAGRGYFWSGSQLHAVRSSRSAIRAIAGVNLFSSVGLLAGPVVAGYFAERAPDNALVVAAVVASAGAACALLMTRFDPVPARSATGERGLWRRRDVGPLCRASAVAGAWTSILISYIPVVLAARQPATTVGVLVAAANAANILGSVAVAGVRPELLTRWLAWSALTAGVGIATVEPSAASWGLAAVVLTVGGFGAGALLTLGPALAAAAVPVHQRPAAIALTGGARAAAMIAAPLLVAGVAAVVPLAGAMAVVGATLCWTPRRARDESTPG